MSVAGWRILTFWGWLQCSRRWERGICGARSLVQLAGRLRAGAEAPQNGQQDACLANWVTHLESLRSRHAWLAYSHCGQAQLSDPSSLLTVQISPWLICMCNSGTCVSEMITFVFNVDEAAPTAHPAHKDSAASAAEGTDSASGLKTTAHMHGEPACHGLETHHHCQRPCCCGCLPCLIAAFFGG